MSQNSADIDHLLKLVTGEFSVTAILKVQAMTAPELITNDSLNAYLRGRDVQPHCVQQSELDLLVAAVAEDPTQPHERVVAKGRLPEHGANATIKLAPEIAKRVDRIQKRKEAFRMAQETNSLSADGGNEPKDGSEGSAIDFYNESCYVTARAGDHLADFITHTDGIDGIDIFGKSIAAKPGKQISNPTDDTCRLENNGRIVALFDGLVKVLPERISIDSTLSIAGYVDFSTGNVKFPGNIVIEKGVRDRFKVDSDFDIEIHKLVEAAHLRAEHNIKLHQGMAGRESGTINAAGDLDTGYLDAVEARVLGNCTIEREVTNCTLRISGRIEAKGATIRGGLIEVACGGIVGVLGSESGVRTDIVLASHPVLQKEISKIRKIQPKLTAEIERTQREVKVLRASMGRSNPELETEIWYLDSNIKTLQEKEALLEQAIQRLMILRDKYTACELTVVGQIFAKTQLWLPGKQATFERDIKGEFTIRLSKTGSPIIDWGDRTEQLDQYAKLHSDDRVPVRLDNIAQAA